MLTAVELFAGAGGLGLGVSLAGFKPLAVVEWDRWATDTMRANQEQGFPLVQDWPIHCGDVREVNYAALPEGLDLLSGGPPCQPFSMGGLHRAHDDHRDMFPATVEIIRALRPRAFIIENVRGLTRTAFANYYHYILLQLEHPEIANRGDELWPDHYARLQREHTAGKRSGLSYNVIPTLVNAADFGVPQKRERVFMVGFRDDLGVEWAFPDPTHSHEALMVDQWITGDYWRRHRKRRPTEPTTISAQRLEALRRSNDREDRRTRPWATVRDALQDMPEPDRGNGVIWWNHRLQTGARSYPGHTGSMLDLPSKALKAGAHGVPGGENMMVREDGTVRYFSVRESARLQTFPDTYRFEGAWSEAMRQLGNAVPVALAHTVAASVADKLLELDMQRLLARCTEPAGRA